jgi:hypothetical protein
MAISPETPRPPRRRRRRRPPPERPRSNLGRLVGAGIGIATAVGVGAGLNSPPPQAHEGKLCGGTERWNVKSASDPDAKKIDPNPTGPFSVAQLNNDILPGPLSSGGRMAAEMKQYTVRGFLSFFKHEDDGDYHVVVTDQPGGFTSGQTPPNGRSMVVEFPDPGCFPGKSGLNPATSVLASSVGDALATFEEKTRGISGIHIARPIRVTVTGVGFFDFDHGQTGRSTPHPGVDGRRKVFELHPVTAISFDDDPEVD